MQRCVPLSLVISAKSAPLGSAIAASPNQNMCPLCMRAPVSEMHLFAMTIDDLDQAVECRKNSVMKKEHGKAAESFELVQAEASYLLLAHSPMSNGISGEHSYQRTGRWTDEETALTDFLMDAFDKGRLPTPEGIRLNDFLSGLLLCKNSRLTKKMKNAKLSVRSYEFSVDKGINFCIDFQMLSSLESKFLESVSSEPTRLELRFNMTKMWRSHFSNLCLQVGSTLLNASDWISSLETMECRAAQAEESIRKSRRRRMGLALKNDVRAAVVSSTESGVFFSGMPMKKMESSKVTRADSMLSTSNLVSADGSAVENPHGPGDAESLCETDFGSEADFINEMLDGKGQTEDFSKILDDFVTGEPFFQPSNHLRNSAGPFLEEIVAFVEAHNLPFQHVDIWVPSYTVQGRGQPDELRLCHAGHATRSDLDSSLFCQLFEYGEYSTKFSFAPGAGLPGRVYSTNRFSWERHIDQADPSLFKRAGGAKIYGVQTGFGFPLKTNAIGKIVLSMYSTSDVAEDPTVIKCCLENIGQYVPEPKWKLVVEMSDSEKNSSSSDLVLTTPAFDSSSLIHYQHDSSEVNSQLLSVSPLGASEQRSVLKQSPRLFPVQSNALNMRKTSSASMSSHASSELPTDPVEEEHFIATLLGYHMPLAEVPSAREPESSSVAPSLMLPHFMSLRLLLLRAEARRSSRDNELIDVVKKSFRGYSKDQRRTDKDLAFLLVKDWQYLIATMPVDERKPAAKPADTHQCHVLNTPTIKTYSTTGNPVSMPASLGKENKNVVSIKFFLWMAAGLNTFLRLFIFRLSRSKQISAKFV